LDDLKQVCEFLEFFGLILVEPKSKDLVKDKVFSRNEIHKFFSLDFSLKKPFLFCFLFSKSSSEGDFWSLFGFYSTGEESLI